ncbi:MAG: YbjN domain-containing protein [Alphaproteobacteria bacterium]|nr:YbjN domain-containing protein [Alphaproteobacteria bacterium]
MNVRMPDQAKPLANPIELLERFVDVNDWRLHHASPNEISVEVPGKWADYHLTMTWQDQYSALHINAMLDIYIIDQQLDAAREVLSTINQNIWMGHFDLLNDDGSVVFRHNLPLRGTGGATPEQMEDLVDITLGECERAYPALFQIATGVVSAETASATALMETAGSA